MRTPAVVSLALGATALGGMPMWLMSAYSPQIVSSFSLEASTYGLLLGSFFGFSALTATPVGRYVSGINWLSGITLTALFSVLGLLFLSFFSFNIGFLVLGLFIAAWGNSFSQTSANKGLAQFVPLRLQGRAFGFKQAALPLSTLFVGLSVPLFSADENWKYAFLLVALISAAVGLMAWLSSESKAEGWNRMVQAIRFGRRTTLTARPDRMKAPRHIVLLATASGIATGATMSFTGFLVLYAVSEGFSAERSALVLALGSFAGIAARISAGFWADRAVDGHFRFVQILMLGGALGFGLLAATTSFSVLVLGTLLGFALGWSWNGVFHFAIVRSKPEHSAFFTGIVQAAMMAGATLGPPLFGLLSEWSFSFAWWFLALAMLSSAALVARGAQMMTAGP